jgi:hypothetical protein
MSITLFPKKITPKTMRLRPQQLNEIAEKNPNAETPILRVWGVLNVADRKSGTTALGTYVEYGGEIGAINLITGEEARSQKLILPQVAETVTEALLSKAVKVGAASVQIGMDIAVEFNEAGKQRGGNTYKYVVLPLVEVSGDDALAAMLNEFPVAKILNQIEDKRAAAPKKAAKK